MEKSKRFYLKIIILTAFIIIFSSFFYYMDMAYRGDIRHIKPHEIKAFLLSFGKWSVAVFIIISAIRPVILVLPVSVLSIVSGILYGPVFGMLNSMIGAFAASTLAFYIARILGKDTVERFIKGKIAELDDDIEKNGFKIMLLLRLAIVFPFDALSYAAGLSKMKYRDFIFGTIIGILPEMFAYTYLGRHIRKPFGPNTLLIFLTVAGIAFFAFKIKDRKDKK